MRQFPDAPVPEAITAPRTKKLAEALANYFEKRNGKARRERLEERLLEFLPMKITDSEVEDIAQKITAAKTKMRQLHEVRAGSPTYSLI